MFRLLRCFACSTCEHTPYPPKITRSKFHVQALISSVLKKKKLVNKENGGGGAMLTLGTIGTIGTIDTNIGKSTIDRATLPPITNQTRLDSLV